MTDLTAASIKMRFPEFSDASDAQIEFAIEEASRNVDSTWLAKDRILAWAYLSAHYMTVSIYRSASVSSGGQQVISERIGEISVTYAQTRQPTIVESSDLTTSPYGVRFLELARLNFPSVAVI